MSKIWFITGANRGLGAGIVRAVLAAGHRVVATARQPESLREAFGEAGERALYLKLDVSDEAQAQQAVQAAVERFGRIDVLVNNAGYGQMGAFEEVSAAEIERQYATNVFGLMHVLRAALPVMRSQRAGHVFNVSSIGGTTGFDRVSIYCSTKFAVEGLSEGLAKEVAPFGIHVTIVEPGRFRTDFLDASSLRFGAHAIADYAEGTAASRAERSASNGQQSGDPVRLGVALLELAGRAQPPLRFAAGPDALDVIRAMVKRRHDEVEALAELSASTDGRY